MAAESVKYTWVPSLRYIAVVKVAAMVWNTPDIRVQIEKYLGEYDPEVEEKWHIIGHEVRSKIPLLPEPLKKSVSCVISALGRQILGWIEYHEDYCKLMRTLPKEFRWTPHGTIDAKKTIEIILKEKKLDIETRFKIACTYCLKEDINNLWTEFNPELKERYLGEVREDELPLVVFWTRYVKGGNEAQLNNAISSYCSQDDAFLTRCSSANVYGFARAAYGGNKAATAYFLQELTPEERGKFVVEIAFQVAHIYSAVSREWVASQEQYADVLCFLLSTMTTEDQVRVFKRLPWGVLHIFLQWPWQEIFMEVAKKMWDFLPRWIYKCFLTSILELSHSADADYDYHHLFKMFWLESPTLYKRFIITDRKLLLELLEDRDSEKGKLILSCVSIARTFVSRNTVDICRLLVRKRKWDLLKYFIEKCLSSRRIIYNIKKEFN